LAEKIEKAIIFDRETCRWSIVGEAAEVLRSAERSRVLRVLRDAPSGLSTSEIASVAELRNRNAADLLLSRMAADGLIERVKRGLYALPGTRASLAPKKERQKDRQKPKSLEAEGDDHLSVDLSLCSKSPELHQKEAATDDAPAADSVTLNNESNINVAASTNMTKDMPDIPTFLRRGHPDCSLRSTSDREPSKAPKDAS
jgi:hypothetical protein